MKANTTEFYLAGNRADEQQVMNKASVLLARGLYAEVIVHYHGPDEECNDACKAMYD